MELTLYFPWSTALIETIKDNCTRKYAIKRGERKEMRREKKILAKLRWSEFFSPTRIILIMHIDDTLNILLQS